MKKPHILITNDDGIDAIGLKFLYEALTDIAEISIAAPDRERSGAGLGITFATPLLCEEVKWAGKASAWKISGTPADCVRLAVSQILKSPPDLIVSGINQGSNAGRNVLYSGTIGGVIEGVLRNIPGIAFSFSDPFCNAFEHVKQYIPSIVEHLFEHPFPNGTLLNVNFPVHPEKEIKGYKLARQGRSYWTETPEKEIHESGEVRYWMNGALQQHDEHVESDIHLLEKGFITAVPIHVSELTDLLHLENHKPIFEEKLNRFFKND